MTTTKTTAPGQPRRSPDKEQLKKYLAKGMTQQQIRDQWLADSGESVTREAISIAMKTFGLKPAHPRARYDDMIPWRVNVEHNGAYDARMLRAEARTRAMKTRKQKEADPEWDRLQAWKRKLTMAHNTRYPGLGAVVAYHPAVGFIWMERLPTDADDDLIRRPGLPEDPAA